MAKITKWEMAHALSSCRISGFYRKSIEWICKHYSWQELKDCYDQINDAWEEYYSTPR